MKQYTDGVYGADSSDGELEQVYGEILQAQNAYAVYEPTYRISEFSKAWDHWPYEEDARRILTADMWARKRRRWPLVMQTPQKQHSHIASLPNMFQTFPFIEKIIRKYPGEVCVAGGAVANHLFPAYIQRVGRWIPLNKDVDIFFYGITEARATEIVEDLVAMLCSEATVVGYDGTRPPGDIKKFRQVRIEKSLKFINVMMSLAYSDEPEASRTVEHVTYQFILRIYPTFDSIVGAFDIPASSFAWDGVNFWGTEIADWCMKKKVLIANISRRSPSFSYRLVKYCKRFGLKLFFPGLDMEKYFTTLQLPDEVIVEKVLDVLNENGCRCISNRAIEDIGYVVDSSNVSYPTPFHRIVMCRDGNVNMSGAKITNVHSKEESARISDYNHAKFGNDLIRPANSSACAAGNPDGVLVCHSYIATPKYEDVLRTFRQMNFKPVVTVLTGWHLWNRYNRTLMSISNAGNSNIPVSIKIKRMGHNYEDQSQEGYEQFCRTHAANAKLAARNLKGLKWMTTNPDVQWTASNTPIHSSALEYYGKDYRCFEVGIPRPISEVLLLGFYKDPSSLLSKLNRDCFRYLMLHILHSYSD